MSRARPFQVGGVSTWLIVGAAVIPLVEALVGFPGWLRDTIRAVELVEGTFIVVISMAISRRYYANFKAEPSSARLLPRHVVRLGVGTTLLTVGGCVRIINLLGHPFAWYGTPLVFPAFTALAVGLVDIVTWLPERGTATDDSSPHD